MMLKKMGIFASQIPPNGTIVSDTFSRADSTTSLGMTETGETWIPFGSKGVWGISSGRAYLVNAAGNDGAYVETSLANAKTSADITYVTGKIGGVMFRINGSGNFIHATLSSTGISLTKRVSAVNTEIGSYSFTPVNGTVYHLAVTANGTSITVSLDGVDIISVTESFQSTTTKSGIRMTKTLYIDNFKVEAL